MNKLCRFVKESPASLTALGVVIIVPVVVGFGFSAWVLVSTIISENLASSPLCFSNECVQFFLGKTEQSFAIAKATLDLGVAVATIGGIFVALLSYFSSASNAALTNHIEHLKVFREYLESEIGKRDRLSLPLIDGLYLYGVIFTQSRSGKTTVSDEYLSFIKKLNCIIDESNQRCVQGTPGGFSYNDHQRRVRDHLIAAGVTIYVAPRNDYFETEGQLFSLLDRIGQSFCSPGVLPPILSRTYY